jgi:osmotically-inducible protein OsmY
MKAVDMLKALGLVLCVAVASSAYAQTTDTTTDSSAASSKATSKTTKKVDRKLGLDVRKALSKAQGLDISNIFVRARGGAVVLTGSVPDGAQIPKAEEVAKGVAGVTSVSNKLSISPQNGS